MGGQRLAFVPLSEAADMLGISRDAARKRLKRGNLRGKRDGNGRWLVEVDSRVDNVQDASMDSGVDMSTSASPHDSALVQFQKDEIDRLRHDNERLNERVDKLIQQQENEQVLRRQLQAQLERLAEQRALPAPGALHSRLEESERNVGMLKGGLMQLLRYLEKRKA